MKIKTRREKSRLSFGNFGIKCIALMMAVVMAFTIARPMVAGVRQSEALAATQVTQELTSTNEVSGQQECGNSPSGKETVFSSKGGVYTEIHDPFEEKSLTQHQRELSTPIMRRMICKRLLLSRSVHNAANGGIPHYGGIAEILRLLKEAGGAV